MKEVTYYLADNCGNILLMKRVRDPETGIYSGFIWNGNKYWVEAWDLCYEYFFGYESAILTDAEGAKKYMIEEGATVEEANKFINEDME